ncbi:MAG: D-glycerate dehydrogenase [Gammaproteobacteria bacterium]|nr:D-glycerate dehydrogenase [Gammaproteobacteria bacterium]
MKPKVLIDMPLPDFLGDLFAAHCEFVRWSALGDSTAALGDISGMLTYSHPRVGAAELDSLPSLKVVSNYGVGVDHIDLVACRAAGVPVGNTPGLVDGATADLTMGILLAIARNILPGDRFARSPEFTHYDPGYLLGRDVFGSTLGIVGMGRIGREIAKRARGFDMRIVYHNRRPDAQAEALFDAEYLGLDELLGRADFVSLNTPLTDETHHLIGERELRLMRRDSFLINTARGGVVDTDALHTALSEQWIAGAAIDVTEPEPLERDHPILKLENLLITPHLGTSTVDTRVRMGLLTRDNLLAGLAGNALVCEAS